MGSNSVQQSSILWLPANAFVTQLEECPILTRDVDGSIPSESTKGKYKFESYAVSLHDYLLVQW